MGGNPGLDNGDYFLRAQRAAQQQAINQYNSYPGFSQMQNLYNPHSSSVGPPTPGEKPEPEDTTGLKMLEKFLAKRKGERDGK